MRRISADAAAGKLKQEDISEETVEKYLETSFMPDPELLIRTGGELRLSNYLLWQCAYAELYFCDTYWRTSTKLTFSKPLHNISTASDVLEKPANK